MEQYVLNVTKTDGWTYIGGDAEAKKPYELVVRTFDGHVLIATGETDGAPDSDPVSVREGEGRRLEGKHFFVRPAPPERPCVISHRGLVE